MANMVPFNPRHMRVVRSMPMSFADDWFRSFFNMGSTGNLASFGNTLRVDIQDKEDHYLLEAELPGVEREQIKLSVENGILHIGAQVENEVHQERENYLYSERRRGNVQRSFDLNGIQEDQIKASYKDGVLSVILPKDEQDDQRNRAHDIPIQ